MEIGQARHAGLGQGQAAALALDEGAVEAPLEALDQLTSCLTAAGVTLSSSAALR
jgi:hypothetical protein